ncbi:MAG: putative Ig domain-containing protein, partial [Planctomycetota bacterium]
NPSITTSSLSDATQNQAYSQVLQATGGAVPYTWSISTGSLPGGLTINSSTGTISGTPTTTGTSTFTVKVEDSSSTKQSATKQLSIVVAGTGTGALSISTSSLPGGTVNQNYSQQIAATGGTGTYSWSVSSGILPNGLNINFANGKITGIPIATGTSTFTVKVTDSSTPQQSATKQLSIVVTISTLTCGASWETNLCQARVMTCTASACSQYVSAINQYASRTGMANGVNFLKAIMIKESACNVAAQSPSNPPSCGLMQLKASTANIYKSRCGVSNNVDITCDWLRDSVNANASICIAAEYMNALTQSVCGSTPRGVAAGYNGGSGACNQSVDCAGATNCAGGAVQRWECLYDNSQHTICNTGYTETRDYATKVLYCYSNPGF